MLDSDIDPREYSYEELLGEVDRLEEEVREYREFSRTLMRRVDELEQGQSGGGSARQERDGDDSGPEKWEKIVDPDGGEPFYMNTVTGELKWEQDAEAEND